MWRVVVPALAMMAALITPFAGVLGDLKSLPGLSDRAIAMIGGTEPRHGPPSATQGPRTAGLTYLLDVMNELLAFNLSYTNETTESAELGFASNAVVHKRIALQGHPVIGL